MEYLDETVNIWRKLELPWKVKNRNSHCVVREHHITILVLATIATQTYRCGPDTSCFRT